MMLFILISCGGGNSSDSNNIIQNELIGIWTTELCSQQKSAQGQPTPVWDKGIFHFTSEGSFFFKIYVYDNADCSGQELVIINWPLIPSEGLLFKVTGPELTAVGVPAYNVTFFEKDFLVNIKEHKYFLNIENNRLCKSAGLILEPNNFGFSNDIEIDFVNCLTKKI